MQFYHTDFITAYRNINKQPTIIGEVTGKFEWNEQISSWKSSLECSTNYVT
jgi:hypothetical protein